MAGSTTPTKQNREARLSSKPYDRGSQRNATPQRAAPGLLRFMMDKVMSPFSKRREPFQDPDESQIAGPSTSSRQLVPSDEDPEDDEEVIPVDADEQEKRANLIQPMRDMLLSNEPVSVAHFTQVFGVFMVALKEMGQAESQTEEEKTIIANLMRKSSQYVAEEDYSMGDTTNRLGVSVSGRGLFDSPSSGARSTFADPNGDISSPLRSAARKAPETPLRTSHLTQATSTPSSSILPHDRDNHMISPFTGRPITGRGPKQYAGPGMSTPGPSTPSQSSPSTLHQDPLKRKSALQGNAISSNSNQGSGGSKDGDANPRASGGHVSLPDSLSSSHGSKSSPTRTAAAELVIREIEQAAAESKLHVSPGAVVNPYEGLTFHIGSNTLPSTSSSRSMTSRTRRQGVVSKADSTQAQAQVGQKRMSDFEFIESAMHGGRQPKKSRVESESQTPASRHDEMDVDSALSSPTETQPAAARTKEILVPSVTAAAPSTSTQSVSRFQIPSLDFLVSPTVSETITPRQAFVATPSNSGQDMLSPQQLLRTDGAATNTSTAQPHPFQSSGPIKTPSSSSILTPKAADLPSVKAKQQTAEDQVRKMQPAELPLLTFVAFARCQDLSKDDGITHDDRMSALGVNVKDLPTFFGAGSNVAVVNPSLPVPAELPAATPAIKAWTGGVLPSSAKEGEWSCGECGLKSGKDAVKCGVCEAERPASAQPKVGSAVPNLWAGRFAQPANDGKWKCDICSCLTANEKTNCIACENPKPK